MASQKMRKSRKQKYLPNSGSIPWPKWHSNSMPKTMLKGELAIRSTILGSGIGGFVKYTSHPTTTMARSLDTTPDSVNGKSQLALYKHFADMELKTLAGSVFAPTSTTTIQPINYLDRPEGDPILLPISYHHPRTQKAKGVLKLRYADEFRFWGIGNPLVYDIYPLGLSLGNIEFPCFARPCPMTPRHGFVDSRMVSNWAEVARLYSETSRADQLGEIILMPKLTAKWSGVATNAGVAWGFGNAGVTDGQAGTKMIPVSTSRQLWNNAISSKVYLGAIGITDTAYLELVENEDHSIVVQVRDGPPASAASNWVPEAFETAKRTMIRPNSGSLLEWEAHVRGIAPASVYVYLPGHALSSHWAVHAIQRGIPVITDDIVATTYEPEAELPPPLGPDDYQFIAEAIRRFAGMHDFIGTAFKRRRAAAATALGVNHAQVLWGNEEHLLRLRALGVVLMSRLTLAGVAGELRHWWREGPGRREPSVVLRTPIEVIREDKYGRNQTFTRDTIQLRMLTEPTDWALSEKRLMTMKADFDAEGWSGNFGGYKWGEVAAAGATLLDRVQAFLRYPSEETWTPVVFAMNILVNTDHNNGSIFDKWVSGMTYFSEAPGIGFMNSIAAEAALGWITEKHVSPFELASTERFGLSDDDATIDYDLK